MEPITLEINSFREEIYQVISKYPLEDIHMENKNLDGRVIYIFKTLSNSIHQDSHIYHCVTNLIEEIIIKVYTEDLINKGFIKIFRTTDKEEKLKIRDGVMLLIEDEKYCIKEKIAIRKEIISILREKNLFNIDGYLRFKPHKINLFIDKSIETTIEDIQIESEYDDFIDMLQYYVKKQTPIVDLINVIIEKDDFKLLDSYNNEIEGGSINEIIDDLYFDEISKSDILVSSLIVLAPKQIILHVENEKEEDLLIVLKNIFKDRLSFCYGCNLCRFNTFKNKDGD